MVEKPENGILQPFGARREDDLPAALRLEAREQRWNIGWPVFSIRVHHHDGIHTRPILVDIHQAHRDRPLMPKIAPQMQDGNVADLRELLRPLWRILRGRVVHHQDASPARSRSKRRIEQDQQLLRRGPVVIDGHYNRNLEWRRGRGHQSIVAHTFHRVPGGNGGFRPRIHE